MRINILGIVGGILGFVGLALPWWTISVSAIGYSYSVDISAYLYQVTALGSSATAGSEYWYGWATLALLLVGSILALVGGATAKRVLLAAGGILALVGAILFPVALQMNFATFGGVSGGLPSQIGVFSSGSYQGANYTSYLTFGFWIALVGAILILVAATRKTRATAPVAVSMPPPPPPAQV